MMEINGKNPRAVTVYGASSPRIDSIYLDVARQVGSLLAREGIELVCGGGRTGIMGAAIEGCVAAGGTAVGVLPAFMVERGWQHSGLSRMETTPDMHSRKELMARMAYGVIAMPGGVGTLEELLEIITWHQLGLYNGNVVILNTEGYYDPLLQMLQRSIDCHFMNPDHASLWQVATTPEQAVDMVLNTPVVERPFSQKIV